MPVPADPAAYADFTILVDEPAAKPLLGFDANARAFAQIIEHSRAQFAIGIFGSWGSGKTTLMRAIEKDLSRRRHAIPVWFNAWRYEREEHLIVPLLDTLRERLEQEARRRRADAETRERARETATAMGRAARRIARGLTLKAAIPLTGIGVEADLGAMGKDAPTGPTSFYYAAFAELDDAVRRFGEDGARRIVVFVDDLDRCLPASALSVLESMKLFFDVEGFVFVVGLDQDVVQRAIEAKYGAASLPGASENGGSPPAAAARGGSSNQSGADELKRVASEYVKKIFQVPFSLPRLSTAELERFFVDLLRVAMVPEAQRRDLRDHVRPHVQHLASEGAVNPREVKRLINAYTLQMKLLSGKRGLGMLEPHAVVALLTMSFRAEWRSLYNLLVADPSGFTAALRVVRDSGDLERVTLWPGTQAVPRDFLDYLNAHGGAILDVPDLEPYVASVEATRSSWSELAPTQSLVVDLGRRLARAAETGLLEPDALSRLHGDAEHLWALLSDLPSVPLRTKIRTDGELVVTALRSAPSGHEHDELVDWATRTETLLRTLYEDLRQLRLLIDVGGRA